MRTNQEIGNAQTVQCQVVMTAQAQYAKSAKTNIICNQTKAVKLFVHLVIIKITNHKHANNVQMVVISVLIILHATNVRHHPLNIFKTTIKNVTQVALQVSTKTLMFQLCVKPAHLFVQNALKQNVLNARMVQLLKKGPVNIHVHNYIAKPAILKMHALNVIYLIT